MDDRRGGTAQPRQSGAKYQRIQALQQHGDEAHAIVEEELMTGGTGDSAGLKKFDRGVMDESVERLHRDLARQKAEIAASGDEESKDDVAGIDPGLGETGAAAAGPAAAAAGGGGFGSRSSGSGSGSGSGSSSGSSSSSGSGSGRGATGHRG